MRALSFHFIEVTYMQLLPNLFNGTSLHILCCDIYFNVIRLYNLLNLSVPDEDYTSNAIKQENIPQNTTIDYSIQCILQV